MSNNINIPEIFGCDVFNEATMKQHLSPEIYVSWKQCIANGTSLTLDVANEIAKAMRIWAIEKGATHYTHWFQPMTGITAEKHDSFIEPAGDGKVIMQFKGTEESPMPLPSLPVDCALLLKQEAIQHGILQHSLSLKTTVYISPHVSSPIPVPHWIKRHPCCALWTKYPVKQSVF